MLKSLMSGTALLGSMVHGAADVTAENIAAMEPGDVQEYRGYFKLVYNRETTLSHEELASLVLSTDDDMEPKDWAETMLNAEASEENDDRSPTHDDSADSDLPATSSAFEFADMMDDELAGQLETSAKAALEGKRGGAVIARKLIALHGENTIVNVWPVPGSEEEKGTPGLIGNRTADYYKTVVHKDDGTSATGDRSWYRDYLERSKAAKDLMLQLKSIKAVTANETAPYILPDHEAVRGDKIKIKSKRSAIDSALSNKKGALVRAVNLIQKMAFLNAYTEFNCEIMTENGEPVQSNKIIQVWDKKDQRIGNALTIGQLLALKNITEGASYSAIVGSTGRKPKGGTGTPVQNINIDSIKAYDDGMAAYAQFFTKLSADTKATNTLLTHLNADGGDDLLLSMNTVMTGIEGILSKPAYAKRLQGLLAGTSEKREALKAAFANGPKGKAA